MTYFLHTSAPPSATAERLKDIRMSNAERRAAEACVRQGERFAETVLTLTAGFGRLAGALRRTVASALQALGKARHAARHSRARDARRRPRRAGAI